MNVSSSFLVELDASRYTILIIDDNPVNLKVLFDYLKEYGFRIAVARDGESGLQRAQYVQPDIILLDILMPGMDGFELCSRLKANEATSDIPVIFMTSLSSTDHKIKGFSAGAVDYVTKPLHQEEVLARLSTHLRLRDLTRELQKANADLSRRAAQLEISSEVGRQVTSILDMEDLLHHVVTVIKERFGYYVVSVWLVEEEQQHLMMHASQGPKGKSGVEARLCIPLKARSIIAKVCQTGDQYLANDVTRTPDFRPEERWPDTRSELALPLRMGKRVLGALDIQSALPNAFTNEDRMVLQTLADQIAISMRNVRLFNEIIKLNQRLEQRVVERTAELEKAYHTLEQLEKTKSDFIDIASHELRTPLTLIQGYAQLLERSVKDNPEARSFLTGILSGQQRLTEIVDSMLDVARITSQSLSVRVRSADVATIVREIQDTFTKALERRQISFQTRGLETLPHIQADTELLHKLFYHLVINAIKYTPDGGSITVTGKRLNLVAEAPAIEIIIRDTGIGIDPAHHELIFEKFFQTGSIDLHSSGRTKFKGGGPGLGLAIARGIVEAHNGHIWVESPGHDEITYPGSEFHVVLPQKAPNRVPTSQLCHLG